MSASLSGHLERPRHLESANSAETERQILSQQSTARPSSPLVPLLPSPLHSRTLAAAHTSQQHPPHRQASTRPVRIDSEELPRPQPRLRPLSQSPTPSPRLPPPPTHRHPRATHSQGLSSPPSTSPTLSLHRSHPSTPFPAAPVPGPPFHPSIDYALHPVTYPPPYSIRCLHRSTLADGRTALRSESHFAPLGPPLPRSPSSSARSGGCGGCVCR